MNKKFGLLFGLVGLLVVLFLILNFSGQSSQWLWNISKNGTWLLPLVVVAAFLDSFNPCAFSILFLTIAFLFNLGKDRKEIVKLGSVYILGILLVYILIGLGILQVLHIFNTPHFMSKLGAGVLLVWGGINLLNKVFPKFPIKLKIPSFSHGSIAKLIHKSSVGAALGLGVVVGLCEFPCTGGPYLMVLALLHDQNTYLPGLGYLIIYNLIFISPLIVILALASDKFMYEKVKSWKKEAGSKFETISAVVMILIALFILWL